MKTRYKALPSIAVLLLAITSTSACATPLEDKKVVDDTAKKEICFRIHGKLMDKPALMNIHDCWRVHGYLMGRRF